MEKLKLYPLNNVSRLKSPELLRDISLDSPALQVFTDFHERRPYQVHYSTRAVDAERLMIQAHVKMKLVVDDAGAFLGLVSLNDLAEEKIIRLVAAGTPRHEVTVSELMTPRSRLKGLCYQDLMHATVQDVLDAVKEEGLQHCLVLDRNDQSVRGLISASDIVRKLHVPFSLHRAPSFCDIVFALSASRRVSMADALP